jgi:hypothetical protein
VAVHVDHHAAAVFAAVVPARALDGLVVLAGEDPVAELAAHGEDLAEEALLLEQLELADAGQPELVLDDAVFHAGGFGEVAMRRASAVRHRGGFLAIDVLARSDGLFEETGCGAGVPEASKKIS